jgi:hypothetical protein
MLSGLVLVLLQITAVLRTAVSYDPRQAHVGGFERQHFVIKQVGRYHSKQVAHKVLESSHRSSP